ncbi:MAG: alpha/beta hydrolase [Prevotellaceae bacterium]|jgi:acetyl esterase/lipase|nr:alpha/beta hydrolase [Prevotellaceae bacterium]
MKKYLLILISFVCCVSVYSQQTIKLWDENPTRKEKWSELTVFLPEKPDTSGISVIICPGGSYIYLDMDNEGFSVAKYLNSKGITAFVLKYRTAWQHNHHPAMIQDLQRAMQIVKENAEKYKIDPEKVGVMGFSAGGHLAGTAAEYFDLRFVTIDLRQSQVENRISHIELKPYFAAMIYPVVTMTNEETVHKKSRKNLLGKDYTPELANQMSLEKNVHEDMPPIFLLHCTGDKTVDYRNSVAMDKALTEKNVKHKFLLFEENGHGGHGFGIQPNGKATGWIDEFLEWLNEL